MNEKNDLLLSVVLIDKPKGPTSFDVVEKVSKILGIRKAGHSGTLDPNATGVMLIALGESRKAMPVLTGLDKEYVGKMRLHGEVEKKKLQKVLGSFLGEITQTPPVRSAVARKPRKRKVYEIELLGFDNRTAEFRVLCEAGTYIRKIASDAGDRLGCGAHLIDLIRTKVGPFTLDECITIDKLAEYFKNNAVKKHAIPLLKAMERIGLDTATIKNEYEEKVRNGSPIRKEFILKGKKAMDDSAFIAIVNEQNLVVSLAKHVKEKDTFAKSQRIFLNPMEVR